MDLDICILSDRFPPHGRGGAAVIAKQLAEAYRDRGHNVSVITTVRERADDSFERRNGIAVRKVYTQFDSRYRAYYSIYNPQTVSQVGSSLERFDPDVVHAHNVHEFLSYYTLRVASNRSLPVVLTYHDAMSVAYGKVTDVPEGITPSEALSEGVSYEVSALEQFRKHQFRYFPLRNHLNRYYLSTYVDEGIAVSHELGGFLSEQGVNCRRVIHNGVSTAASENADGASFREEFELEDAKIVLFGGRVSRLKGSHQLAQAIRSLAAGSTDATLVVTGETNRTTKQIATLLDGYDEQLVTTGWISTTKMAAAFDAADIVASPSLYLDPFPTVNLEAMAAGTPVVTTCFGGAKELVEEGHSGIIVNPFDTGALANAIQTLLEDEELRAQYGSNAKRRVDKDFDLASAADAYLSVMRDLVDRSA